VVALRLLIVALLTASLLSPADVMAEQMKLTAASAYSDKFSGMEFVKIPEGCFVMGDTHGDGQGDEKPLHEVCIDVFFIGRYEVTNSQYRKFRPDHNSGSYEGNNLNDNNQPVTSVTWNDAAEYAKWLSKKSGRSFRLPTEAEWEYVARGGNNGRNYWGDNPDIACKNANGADLTAKKQWSDWTTTECSDSYKVSAPVGSFQPNGYGVHDIMGNAWEWTNDWYDAEYYFESPGKNPQGPKYGKLKIPRGGGWMNASECVRVADRNGFLPNFSINFLGFRLVSSDFTGGGK
jgi:formylglycine-generating enzyme required for sulfatase activity